MTFLSPVYLHIHCRYNVPLILSLIWSVGNLLIIKTHFILLVAFSMPTTKKKEALPGPSRLVNDWQFVINMNCYEDIQSVDDHYSFTHKLSSCDVKAWMDLNPWPQQYHGSTLPTALLSQCFNNSMQINAEITVIFFKKKNLHRERSGLNISREKTLL